jgi:hypothetical protein
MCLFGDIRNSVHEKSHGIQFREIPRNFTELYDTEFSGISRNFSQFRTEYGIAESKKNRRNSVSTEFREHPRCMVCRQSQKERRASKEPVSDPFSPSAILPKL